MRRLLFCSLIIVFTIGFLAAQNGIIGTGFSTGWTNPADVTGFSPSAGNSRILTTNANGTGNQFFRMVRFFNADNSEFGPFGCTDTDWSTGEGFSYDNMPVCGSGAFFINASSTTDNYVFKTPGPLENDFIYFVIEGPVASIFSTDQGPQPDPMGRVASNTPVLVISIVVQPDLITPDFNPGQTAYIRYTTDGFATSTVLPMSGLGSGLYEAIIPGFPSGTTVTYYTFTSGDGTGQAPQGDGSDADYRTINLDNNGGMNYTYTTDIALPVSYSSWTGERTDQGVDLHWATATEYNASHFELECSEDQGRSWNLRTSLVAQNSTSGANYRYHDLGAPAGNLQYRLRQVDVDGTFNYSSILAIAGKTPSTEVRVWPQPSQGVVNIDFPSQGTEALELYNSTGQRVVRTIVNQSPAQLSTEGLPSGIYWLRVINENQNAQQASLLRILVP